MQNRCPKCTVPRDERGGLASYPARDPKVTTTLLADAVIALQNNKELSPAFKKAGLKALHPFWVDLLHCNIFECITSDILHQLHKGVFKDHVVEWTTAIADEGASKIDQRFCAMTAHPDLR